MLDRSGLTAAIELVENRVRSGDRLTIETLAAAIAALDELQDQRGMSTCVAFEARATQHWLSQYVACLIGGSTDTMQLAHEANLRRLTLDACEHLRIAIARSWVGAA
jgi:hypothetical protein